MGEEWGGETGRTLERIEFVDDGLVLGWGRPNAKDGLVIVG